MRKPAPRRAQKANAFRASIILLRRKRGCATGRDCLEIDQPRNCLFDGQIPVTAIFFTRRRDLRCGFESARV